MFQGTPFRAPKGCWSKDGTQSHIEAMSTPCSMPPSLAWVSFCQPPWICLDSQDMNQHALAWTRVHPFMTNNLLLGNIHKQEALLMATHGAVWSSRPEWGGPHRLPLLFTLLILPLHESKKGVENNLVGRRILNIGELSEQRQTHHRVKWGCSIGHLVLAALDQPCQNCTK